MKKPNILDRAIMTMAPVHAAKRAAARVALSVIKSGYGSYGANLTKKSMRGWMYHGGSAKEDIEDNIDILRQRSRDAYMGIPTATVALKTMRTNVVAGGLMPAPQLDSDYLGPDETAVEKLQAQFVREFALWADTPVCDAERMDNFYQLQQLAFLSYLMNSDTIALLPMKHQAGAPYDLRVRLIEADRVCSPDGFDRLMPCTVQGYEVQSIVQGVETDADGSGRHGDGILDMQPASAGQQQRRGRGGADVAKGDTTGRRNVLHIMSRERIGQRRGVPLLAPVLESLKQLGRYTDAEITAAVISAMFTVFVKSQNPSDGRPFGEMIPAEELIDNADQSSIELGPGAIIDLNPGEEVQFADPKHPNTGYDDFTNATIRLIGAGLEIPPEVMMKQFTTSYSAARGALNEFWRTCSMQRDWFTDDFCQPVYEEWFAEAVARGSIHAPGFFTDPARRKAYTACAWNGPARTNLNPVQEVDAAIKRVDAGFSTAQEETAQMTGGDYNRNIKLRMTEAKRKREVDEIGKAQTAGE